MICQSLQFYWGARVHEDFKKHGWPAGGLPLGLLELHAVDNYRPNFCTHILRQIIRSKLRLKSSYDLLDGLENRQLQPVAHSAKGRVRVCALPIYGC